MFHAPLVLSRASLLQLSTCRHFLHPVCHTPSRGQHTFDMTFYGDHAPHLAASIITLAVLAYIVFGLRVYTRLRIGAWGMDDWCMAAAMVSTIAY